MHACWIPDFDLPPVVSIAWLGSRTPPYTKKVGDLAFVIINLELFALSLEIQGSPERIAHPPA